ncbi:MAG: hypothetical protein IH576_02605 [Deltaproteobacteria bacterium]|nr:hypothetical protein [Deltaproteobacteria bacterium]
MIRRLWNWHEDPALVDRVRTPLGRLVLLGCIAAVAPPDRRWPLLAALAVLFAFPGRRMEILALAGLWVLYEWLPPVASEGGVLGMCMAAAAVFGLLYLAFAAARRFHRAPSAIRRWPIAWTHLALLSLAVAAATVPEALGIGLSNPVRAAAASVQGLILFLLWRVSYLVLSGKRGRAAGTRFRDHLGYCLPIWGGTLTPYGKGYDYLSAQRMEDDRELAQTRLAGLKLFFLAWVWTKALYFFNAVVTGSRAPYIGTLPDGWSLALPDLTTAIGAGPAAYGAGSCWLTLLAEFLRVTLLWAIQGHVIIGALRLAGFRVFRNTYKPLLATTVVEFWNRYYYYFKELLVEFFFYPVFLATGGRPRSVRIALAVLAAASFGNLYYHLVRDSADYFLHGPWVLLDRVAGRTIYCTALGLGIVVSMLREQRRRGAPAPAGPRGAATLRGIAGVWLFFSLLQVWNVGLTQLTLGDRWRFFLGLFGL